MPLRPPSLLPASALALLITGCQTPDPSPEAAGLAQPVEAEPSLPPEPPPPPPPPPTLSDGSIIQPCEFELDDMACVPGGTFVRGHDAEEICPQPENRADRPPHRSAARVEISTFFMDKTEVTYEAYKACQAEGRCSPAGPYYKDFDRPTQPHMGANWYQAKAYCEAMGKHLPTEAEWEAAARGPEGQLTPFGDEPVSCDQAIIMNAQEQRSCGVEKQFGQPHKGRTFEVASRDPGRYGLFDMVGNAEEWVADWYSVDLDACGQGCLGVNPRGPCDGAEPCPNHEWKLVKGGSWYWPTECATGYNRRPHVPSNKPYHHFGFRCAASYDEAVALAAARAEPAPAEEPPPATP